VARTRAPVDSVRCTNIAPATTVTLVAPVGATFDRTTELGTGALKDRITAAADVAVCRFAVIHMLVLCDPDPAPTLASTALADNHTLA